MQSLLYGILLGWGAAIPIGPINLEITRRNLNYGTAYGVTFGTGACFADLTYLVLLALGALTLINHPIVLQVFGIVGAIILAYFGFMAFRMHVKEKKTHQKKRSIVGNCLEGYVMTFINPYTVLFWGSISSQIVSLTSVVAAGLGVIVGAFSWVLALNTAVHFTRHKFSPNVVKWLNRFGGLIMFGFAIYGLIHAFQL